ncbi:hypothetical protein E1263_15770 [Kribbella antibiotica]|uniref:DUF4440 domain-containing protein n=1 Tax=Kribbella antibiotica TaxID=190195 RepID=A0A4R4ZMT0_9ACTN|nr:DUF4440 domain-containing protein [Kribbella antibiotica]TDD59234.1 hypothetical protein E1263_15770 [Kribbella antibiotica]
MNETLDRWAAGIAAHDPKAVAALFTEDAIFQGLHPYGVGRDAVAEYYDSQPLGLTATYDVLETRHLSDELTLLYLTVDFAFTDRPTITVNLSILLHQGLIAHYQVSRL